MAIRDVRFISGYIALPPLLDEVNSLIPSFLWRGESTIYLDTLYLFHEGQDLPASAGMMSTSFAGLK